MINAEKKPPLPQYIGMASMEENEDIVLVLYIHDYGLEGQSLSRHAKGSPEYEDILQHVGGLKPGESKGVVPWPDPEE